MCVCVCVCVCRMIAEIESTAFGNSQLLANVIIRQILEPYQRAEEAVEHEDDNDTSFS